MDRALLARNAKEALQALAEDPCAAFVPMRTGGGLQTPLQIAMRYGRVLPIEKGCVDGTEIMQGSCAPFLLTSQWRVPDSDEWCEVVAALLREGAADPKDKDPTTGQTFAELAEKSGNARLATLLRHWKDRQTCWLVNGLHLLQDLPPNVRELVDEFLVPEEWLQATMAERRAKWHAAP